MNAPERLDVLLPRAMTDLYKRRVVIDFRQVQDDVACRRCGYGLGIGDPAWFDDTGAVFCSEECAQGDDDL